MTNGSIMLNIQTTFYAAFGYILPPPPPPMPPTGPPPAPVLPPYYLGNIEGRRFNEIIRLTQNYIDIRWPGPWVIYKIQTLLDRLLVLYWDISAIAPDQILVHDAITKMQFQSRSLS